MGQVASNVFGFSHVVLRCTESTTLDDFSNGILIDGIDGPHRIANVIILMDLNLANYQLQIQTLEVSYRSLDSAQPLTGFLS